MVSQLLDVENLDVNSTDCYYRSVLSAAASRGYKEIVSLLLDRGADVNITGAYYGSALGVATFIGYRVMKLYH